MSDVLAWLDEQEEQGDRRPATSSMRRAEALAMIGPLRRGAGDSHRAAGTARRPGLGDPARTGDRLLSVDVELLAGDPAAAAAFAEEACRLFEEAGERSWLSTVVGKLALALYELDRLDEADAAAGRSAELGASDDALTQMLWRQARAKVLARRGDTAEAERLAREAVAIGAGTEMPDDEAEAQSDLAEVLTLAGKNGRGRGRAPGGARPVRAQGQPRHGRAHERETSRARLTRRAVSETFGLRDSK